MQAADVIIVFPENPQRGQKVDLKSAPPAFGDEHLTTLDDVFNRYATRVDQAGDPHWALRRCVVQAEWFAQCFKAREVVDPINMDGWEVK